MMGGRPAKRKLDGADVQGESVNKTQVSDGEAQPSGDSASASHLGGDESSCLTNAHRLEEKELRGNVFPPYSQGNQ